MSTSRENLIASLLSERDDRAQRRFLEQHISLLDDRSADALKSEADHLLRLDIQRSLQTADLLLYQAELTHNPLHRALGLLAKANACSIGLGEHQQAIELYEEAAAIYQSRHLLVDQAKSQIGKLWALASLGRYEEVMETSEWARGILESQGQWLLVAKLTGNTGAIFGRIGQDAKALSLFDRARELYEAHGAGAGDVAGVEYNRAIVLRNLGRLEDSIQASQRAIQILRPTDERIRLARAQQSLATTYYVLGRHNEALDLLEEAKSAFLADGRQRDALLAQLFISDCMLQLRSYAGVLEKSCQVRELFDELGIRFEVAQTILNEAIAYAGLNRYPEALASLSEARRLFEQEGNPVWVATTDLERAGVLFYQGELEASLATAEKCAGVFEQCGPPYRAALAHVVLARAATVLGNHERARQSVEEALALCEGLDVPAITYQSRYLLGRLARARGDQVQALAEYELAIRELERLRGRIMIEFRVDFLEDKQEVYEEIVELSLAMDQPLKGLEYAERAKSRALLDILAYRLDLSIRPKTPADQPIVEELMRLRSQRDQLVRRWEGDEETIAAGWFPTRGGHRRVQQDILTTEKRIMELWHRLLIRNADYACEAALWHVRTEPIQPHLDADTILLEYFGVHGRLVAFLVSADQVQARWMPEDLAHLRRLVGLLRLNLKAVPASRPSQRPYLVRNARNLLQQLYRALILPVSHQLSGYQHVIVVPHGPLHYLPFHALHDGEHHLVERHEISYLPGSSILRHCRKTNLASRGALVVGHSFNGRLPHAVREAQEIAGTMNGRLLVENEATLSRFRDMAAGYRAIHLASHGNFRADNPLFSSLALDDGWLTTLDIFNLRLNASLVTLSGCQTGRSVIGAGDELLGLMRAFLYAGAASLVLSLWPVEDESTARLMRAFYERLAAGQTKAVALRGAQLQFLQAERAPDRDAADFYRHPYFWAAFVLVGDSGPL
jgi:CHAT domain-containing protein/tetratricopeptide (TPR) repeat protein